MLKTSLAWALALLLGAACARSNKSCPSDELRPDQRTGQAHDEGTSETVVPSEPSQERTIILIPVPEEAEPGSEGTPEDVVPAPDGEPQSGDDSQAPTIFLIPIEPEDQSPEMPQDGDGGLQEDVVPNAPDAATSETQVPREGPAAEPAPADPKDIYF